MNHRECAANRRELDRCACGRAEPRCRLRRGQADAVQPERPVRLHEAVTRVSHERLPGDEVVHRGDVFTVAHRRVRNAESGGEITDVFDALVAEPFVQFGCVDVGLLGDRQWRGLVDPLLMAGHGTQVPPLLRGSAAERDQTVGGLRHPRHRWFAFGPPRSAQQLVEGHRIVGETQDLRLQRRQVDQFTPAVAERTDPRSQGERGGVSPGEPVTGLSPDMRRGPRLLAPTDPQRAADHACKVNSEPRGPARVRQARTG